MGIVTPAVFAGTVTPTALNTAKTIDPGSGVAPWSTAQSGLIGQNVLVGPGVYEAQIDVRLLEALGAGDSVTLAALMSVLPGGPLEVAQLISLAASPSNGTLVQALDALAVQYAAQWQIIQTALASARSGAFYGYDCEIDRLDVGLAAPISKNTTILTAGTQAVFNFTNPGVYSVLLSLRNCITGDAFGAWVTKNVLSSGPQSQAGIIAVSPTTPTVGVTQTLYQIQGITIENTGVLNMHLPTLAAGHSGTYPSVDWRVDQLDI